MTHFTILINITVKCPKRVHIPQRVVKSFKNVLLFVELAQELPHSHLQYTDDPLHNTVINHSTVKCPKTVYRKSIKLKKGHIVWPLQIHLQYTDKPFLTQKVHFLKSTCLKFVSLLPISSCLCWLV